MFESDLNATYCNLILVCICFYLEALEAQKIPEDWPSFSKLPLWMAGSMSF